MQLKPSALLQTKHALADKSFYGPKSFPLVIADQMTSHLSDQWSYRSPPPRLLMWSRGRLWSETRRATSTWEFVGDGEFERGGGLTPGPVWSLLLPPLPPTVFKLIRCRIVGLPWGQFQGCSIADMCSSILLISAMLSAVPTIMLVRHALDAYMARTLLGLRYRFPSPFNEQSPFAPYSFSDNMKMSSSTSSLPKILPITDIPYEVW